MSATTRPTFATLKERLMRRTTSENTGTFFDDAADVAAALNEGLRVQDAYVRAELRKRGNPANPFAEQLEHPYLQTFVATTSARVLVNTTKLLDSAGASPGPDLRDREIVMVQALATSPNIRTIFVYAGPHRIALAQRGVSAFRPTSGEGLWTRTGAYAELDLIFPTPDGKSPEQTDINIIWLKGLDDFTMFTAAGGTVSPVDDRFLAAPLDWAAKRIVERAGQPPDLYEDSYAKNVALIP